MSDEDIEREWRIGHTLQWLYKEYKKEENEKRKKLGQDKITKKEVEKHVSKVVFKYQTSILRGERSWT